MLVMLLLAVASGAAGYWYWHQQGKPVPDVGRITSLTTNLPNLLTNISFPQIHRATNPPASPQTNSPAPATPPRAIEIPQPKPQPAPVSVQEQSSPPRPVRNVLEAQIALARLGLSPGCIDGAWGTQTSRALLAYQIHHALPVSGQLDEETKAGLLIEEPLYIHYQVTQADLDRLMPVPSTWLGKSEQERLDYESILELAAEQGRASMTFVKNLNPAINWERITPGTLIKIPRVDPPSVQERAAFVRIHLYSKTLGVYGSATNLLAHFPCSIAARVEKRPIGELFVAKAAANPNYLFDPAVFTESPEAQQIGRKLMIPPGPNNPVGTAWIGLDKPGYGIHGTPKPEQIGRTESHGCFRLANWNANHLLQLVWAGMPVIIMP